jgi:UDP-N-acetylglucosamine 2-epimerase (non-hydrolysing)
MSAETLRVLFVFGTRPEAIKMAPLVLAMERDKQRFEPRVCVTGQHRQMLDQVLNAFEITPEIDLAVMSHDQSLAALTARVLEALDDVLFRVKPDIVLVQGDTTTAAASALAAFYRHIPVGHVEAGLRTGDLADPFPEEANRILIDQLASFCFAPTEYNRQTLLKEGVKPERIVVTGNTGIDALFMIRDRVVRKKASTWQKEFGSALSDIEDPAKKIVLITLHRRESFGARLRGVFEAISRTAAEWTDASFIYPVHLNPNVTEPAEDVLAGISNMHLIRPLPYEAFVFLMNRACLIVTDSGGIQEEAPSIGKPVIVVRERTERQEALEGGYVKLAGTSGVTIAAMINASLRESQSIPREIGSNPYGDGNASARILTALYERSSG